MSKEDGFQKRFDEIVEIHLKAEVRVRLCGLCSFPTPHQLVYCPLCPGKFGLPQKMTNKEFLERRSQYKLR